MIWGLPRDSNYATLVHDLQTSGAFRSMPIIDEHDGEMGSIVFLR